MEPDWGGRTDDLQGIEEGLPWLLDQCRTHALRGIFFLSTQYLDRYVDLAQRIKSDGHKIGCHGDAHHSWRGSKWYEWRLDYLHAMTKIEKTFSLRRHEIPYRAPKFSHRDYRHKYSDPKEHTSLLKHLWLRQPLQKILYCHPFDLVEVPQKNPPNLFCAVWYRRGVEAKRLMESLLCSNTFESVS